MDSSEEESHKEIRFSNEQKLRKQMRKRKITEEMIRRALASPFEPWHGKLGPAFRYRDPETALWFWWMRQPETSFTWGRRGTNMTIDEIYIALLDEGRKY